MRETSPATPSLPDDPQALRALLLAAWAERDGVAAERDSITAERDALAARNERLQHLLRKYGASVTEVLAWASDAADRSGGLAATDDRIAELNIPTGVPRRYGFDDHLRVAEAEYLGDPVAIAAAAAAVAAQSKAGA